MNLDTVLIIGKVWPEPKSSAAGTRMMQLIDFFQSQNATVYFCTTAKETGFQADIRELNVICESIQLNDDSFDHFIENLNPSVIVFDRFMTEEQFGWRVLNVCPNAFRILNTEDLHFLRATRKDALKRKVEFDYSLLHRDEAYREIASIYRCDLTLMVSEFEMDLLITHFKIPKAILYYLPLFMNETQVKSPSYESRDGFIFIGNYLHEPNWDALRYLKESIWPLIKEKLPSAKLNVYGAYAGEKVMNLHNEEQGFFINGRAEDAQEVTANAIISLAPLRFGAGIKGKLLEAMACGTPSITTSIGAESMKMNDEWAGVIADDSSEFAESAVRLYQDKNSWERAQKSGYKILKARYNKADHIERFRRKFDSIFSQLKEHRSKQFMSQLIQHHSLLSTKYLSKWIEEKNKK